MLRISEEIVNYFRAFLSLGYASKAEFPKVLLDFNMLNFARGLFTRFVASTNLDWVWPYWLNSQLYPQSKHFVSRGFNPVVVNTTQRNWTMIGKLNGIFESVVDPRGLVTPSANSWSLDTWIYIDGEVVAPSRLKKVNQYLLENMPIVVTEFSVKNKLNVKLMTFIGERDENIILHKVEVSNVSKTDIDASCIFSIRPYNPEGISLNKKIRFQEDNTFFVNDVLGGYLPKTPDGTLTSHLSKGDVSLFVSETDELLRYASGTSRVGMCTGLARYNFYLTQGKKVSYEVRIPLDKKRLVKKHLNGVKADKLMLSLKKYKFEALAKSSIKAWKERLNEGLKIEVPDEKLAKAFEANKLFMLFFYDGDSITPGPAIYHHFWFRDAAYMINALDKLGYHDEAERILLTYPRRQRANGFFKSQDGEWDSNGQSIWVLLEHYKLTADKDFLKKVLPSMEKGARWIARKISDNHKKDAGYKGLLPPGLSAEHFGLNDYYYWDDFWALGGLRATIHACQVFNRRTTAYQRTYANLDKSIKDSLNFSEGHLGQPIIPISPSRRMDAAAAGALSAYYPVNVMPATDIRLKNTVKFLQNKCSLNGGFFHDINHSGHNSYLNMHIAQCLIGQRDHKKTNDVLDWILKVASPTFAWPEAIHPHTLGGCVGDGHHGWAAADFIMLTRNILFKEEDNHMIALTPGVSSKWLKKGNRLAVTNAPTYFGTLSFRVDIPSVKKLIYSIDTKKLNNELEFFEINVPKKIKEVVYNKDKLPFHGSRVRIPKEATTVTVYLQ